MTERSEALSEQELREIADEAREFDRELLWRTGDDAIASLLPAQRAYAEGVIAERLRQRAGEGRDGLAGLCRCCGGDDYSADRKSLAQEIRGTLRTRGHWCPETDSGDLIMAVGLALDKAADDGLAGRLARALDSAVTYGYHPLGLADEAAAVIAEARAAGLLPAPLVESLPAEVKDNLARAAESARGLLDGPGASPVGGDDDRRVSVCSFCKRASCWQGAFYCEAYQTAGVVELTVAELRALDRESPHYWTPTPQETEASRG